MMKNKCANSIISVCNRCIFCHVMHQYQQGGVKKANHFLALNVNI